ncbi:hypothetical protein F6Y43_21890 [Salmonella enterica subsp. enterica]|nr:hypothetical protein [Salmonella enterica subsp. enterica]EBO4211057.1 hypothetical protein [Salmonella enterica]EDR3674340.1 hypothetical protein [Salmonella enterica subsp. arizonae serovar 40:z4,z24:]ECY0837350.1 hypothetical protein [Salmonella enterica subsp. enterica]ECY9917674.1 hypothetical protein [Salmonella enterica subsp. enterica]
MTDTKKPAGLVPCGLSVLHRTYPDNYLVELAGVEPASEIPTQTAKTLMNGGQIGCRHSQTKRGYVCT